MAPKKSINPQREIIQTYKLRVTYILMRNPSIKFQNPIFNFEPTDVRTCLFQYASSTFPKLWR